MLTATTFRSALRATAPGPARCLSCASRRGLASSSRVLRQDDGHDGAKQPPPRATPSAAPSAPPTSPFERPGPPPLPPSEQREFERLVKEKQDQSPFLSSAARNASGAEAEAKLLHPDARRKPAPDFEGEVNPTTGEVGGPKKEPLTWEREWTYGGRATDF